MLYHQDKAIREMIEKGDKSLISLYFTHIFPALPKANIERFFEFDLQEIITSDNKESVEVVMNAIGFNDDFSRSYLRKYLFDSEENRSKIYHFVDEAINGLSESVEVVFANACIVADLPVVEKIMAVHGTVNLVMTHDGKNYYADDKVVTGHHEKVLARNAVELEAVIGIMQRSGLGSLLETDKRGQCVFFSHSRVFSGSPKMPALDPLKDHIPSLINGKVINPELLLSMKEALEKSIMPRAFQRMPCWVSKDDLEMLQTKRSYSINQSFEIQREPEWVERAKVLFDSVVIPYDEIKPGCFVFEDGKHRTINARMSLVENGDACQERLCDDGIRMNSFLSHDVLCGFNHPGGMTLCMIDVDELSCFEISSTTAKNRHATNNFVSNFATFELYATLYGSGIWDTNHPDYDVEFEPKRNFGILPSEYASVDEFIKLVSGDKSLLDSAISRLGEKQFFSFVNARNYGVDVYDNLFKFCGYNNDHFDVKVGSEAAVDKLFNSNYIFNPKGENYIDLPRDMSPDAYKKMCIMGLWPDGTSRKPDSIAEGLKILVRNPSNNVMRGYLLSEGVEAVASVCKSEPQWKMLLDVFPAPETAKVMGMMPKGLKRKQVETDFGL